MNDKLTRINAMSKQLADQIDAGTVEDFQLGGINRVLREIEAVSGKKI